MDKEEKSLTREEQLVSFRRLLPYIYPYKSLIALAVLVMIINTAISIILPIISRIAIDDYINPQDLKGLVRVIVIAGIAFTVMNIATFIRARLMAQVGQGIIKEIRLDVFTKLQHLSVSFFDKIPVGKVITRLTSDVDSLAELVSNAIIALIVDTLKLIGFLGFMFWLDWRLTLIVLAYLPLMVFAMTFISGRIRKAEDKVREQTSVVNSSLQESISGIKVIQAFQAQSYFDNKFADENTQLRSAGNRAVATFAFFWPLVDISWMLSIATLLFFGSRWVLDGTTSVGTLIAFFAYVGQFFGPLRGLSQAYRIIQRALAGAVRINEILHSPVETDHSLPKMPVIKGDVEFSDVTFGYERNETILQNINLTVTAGETIALVGHTGAGKTSIINVLCRFYPIWNGCVRVDGLDIHQRELLSYRSQIGLVLQDPYLFSGTLRENLQFGAPKASDDQLWKALETVGSLDLFKQHNTTLDSVLTERGSNYSTGQRQLISFARALLANPRILILDEATAHVDTLTEQKVQHALAKLLIGRTSFVIAHRLSTIRTADKIVVIDNGQIIEQGTHTELLDLKGEYWQLSHAHEVMS